MQQGSSSKRIPSRLSHNNATSGIDSQAISSVRPDTWSQLRELPSTVTAGQSTTVSSSTPCDFNARGGVTLVPTLSQVGPLRLADDPTSTPTT